MSVYVCLAASGQVVATATKVEDEVEVECAEPVEVVVLLLLLASVDVETELTSDIVATVVPVCLVMVVLTLELVVVRRNVGELVLESLDECVVSELLLSIVALVAADAPEATMTPKHFPALLLEIAGVKAPDL